MTYLPLPPLGQTTKVSSLRGTIASDNAVKVDLADGSGNVLTSTSSALDVNIKSGGSANASVSTVNTTAPTSATEIGIVDGTGKLQGASSINPIPISGAITANESRLDLAPITQTVSRSEERRVG